MNDRDTLLAMLNHAGIVWRHAEPVPVEDKPSATAIEIWQGDGPRNVGYGYFLTHLDFDESGNLVQWGCWE